MTDTKSLNEHAQELLREAYTAGHKPLEWRMHPMTLEALLEEKSDSGHGPLQPDAQPQTFMGLPYQVASRFGGLELISEGDA